MCAYEFYERFIQACVRKNNNHHSPSSVAPPPHRTAALARLSSFFLFVVVVAVAVVDLTTIVCGVAITIIGFHSTPPNRKLLPTYQRPTLLTPNDSTTTPKNPANRHIVSPP